MRKVKNGYELYNTYEKVYLHHEQKGPLARYCCVSAEFFDDPLLTIVGCSFKQFQDICKERYQIGVPNTFFPKGIVIPRLKKKQFYAKSYPEDEKNNC